MTRVHMLQWVDILSQKKPRRKTCNYLPHACIVADVCGVEVNAFTVVHVVYVLLFLGIRHPVARPARCLFFRTEECLDVIAEHRFVPPVPMENFFDAHDHVPEVIYGFWKFHRCKDSMNSSLWITVWTRDIKLVICTGFTERKQRLAACFVRE